MPAAPLLRSLIANRIPGQVVIQVTDRCNARCPQCSMRVTSSFSRSSLDTAVIEKTLAAAARQGIQAVSFTGGEPLLDLDRLVALIQHAGRVGIPFIRTGTNGFLFAQADRAGFEDRIARIAERLAATPLRNFWISLDSAEDAVHEKMRGFPGVVKGIARALPIFHRFGIYPAVNLGINRNVGKASMHLPAREAFTSESLYLETLYNRYKKAFAQFYRRAIDLDFTIANACYPMSIAASEIQAGLSPVYGATTTTDIVRFTPAEKRVLFRALAAVIQRFRSQIRIFTPVSSLQALMRHHRLGTDRWDSYGCRGGIDFFYINAADGHAYPCGYRGYDDCGQLPDLELARLRPGPDKDLCRQCDWECFRDPSEMFGPLLEVFAHPLNFIRRFSRYPHGLGTWATDLRYYQACDFFNGRRPPDRVKLNRFKPNRKDPKCELTCTYTQSCPSGHLSGS